MSDDVWVTFKRGAAIPMDVHMSEETAMRYKFHSDEVVHYTRADAVAAFKQAAQQIAKLEHHKEMLEAQVKDLSALLTASEQRVEQLEKLIGLPLRARGKAAKARRRRNPGQIEAGGAQATTGVVGQGDDQGSPPGAI